MKNKILKQLSIQDGFYNLITFYNTLDSEQKIEFWDAIQTLLFELNSRKKSPLLQLLTLYNIELARKILDRIIHDFVIDEYIEVIPEIINIIMKLNRTDLTQFVLKLLNLGEEMQNEEVISICEKCIIKFDWKILIVRLRKKISDGDDVDLIDLLAFFLVQNSEDDWEYLMKILDKIEKKYIETLLPKIVERKSNHYFPSN